jgi:hypothetical protein
VETYRGNDPRAFQLELEHALVIAAGMNRMVLGSDLSNTPAAEWSLVRGHFNTLAAAFGYPLLPSALRKVTITLR